MRINRRGYWENNSAIGHEIDLGLAYGLVDFFKGESAKSILDIGCGLGSYTAILNIEVCPTKGIDGNPNTPQLTNGLCSVEDVSKDLDLGKFDWVLSLEVGEHIPVKYQTTFIGNLDRHNTSGVVLSWAVEGQGGDGHVNCRNNDYIIGLFEDMGYRYDPISTFWLRDKAHTYPKPCYWFKDTLMVFRRQDGFTSG